MKKNPGTFLAVLVMTSGWLVMASNNPRVVFYQDFERGHDPVQLWRTSSSQYRVDFKGLTREKSFSGKGSFKLQVTVKEGSYTYWWLPVKIFPGASLRYSA
ncbi:MAG TPA: hypothetical protein PKW42_10060, partial [bacterium]|nr:hypothetical protein [bacterium]